VARRRGYVIGAPDGTEDRDADRRDRVPEQALVAIRRDAVEYHPGDPGSRVKAVEAAHNGGDRTPGACGVDDEHDGSAEQASHVRG
jgi:hypothetical protein